MDKLINFIKLAAVMQFQQCRRCPQIKLVYLTVLLILLYGCGLTANSIEKFPVNVADSLAVYPFQGVDNVILGESSLKDVQRILGYKPIQKKWIPSYEFGMFGHYDRFIEYPELGIKFSSFNVNKRFHGNKIWLIELNSTCRSRTEDGVGIDSDIEEITSIYTNAKIYYVNSRDTVEITVRAENENYFRIYCSKSVANSYTVYKMSLSQLSW